MQFYVFKKEGISSNGTKYGKIPFNSRLFCPYLILDKEEEEQWKMENKSLNELEAMKVMELKTAWEVKAEERGMKKGIERGKRDGIISIINRIIQVQFPNNFHEIKGM